MDGSTATLATGGTVREVTIALLRAHGMTTVFGNPGSTELPMFRDFPDDFRYVLGLQESIVVGMADGFSQATRQPVLVNLHSSAGVGHALGNIFTAYRNYTPLVITAGQQARSILPYQPFLFAEGAADFPKPFVKYSAEPARAADIPVAIARAIHVAMTPPFGPVFVSIPVDDWDRPGEPVPIRHVSRVIAGDAALLADVAEALAKAKHPALVVGAGIARDNAWDQVIALAERHNAAVWAAPFNARASFPEDHRLFAGFLPAARAGIVDALDGHDLVVVLGGPLSLYHTESDGPHLPDHTRAILLTDDPALASYAPVGDAIITSMKPALTALLAGPNPPARTAPRPRPAPPTIDRTILTDRLLMDRIAARRPSGAIIVEEAPTTRGPMHDHLPILVPDGFYTCASGGLGHGLPAAIGIALGKPGTPIIALLGDGSSMYAIQGLWSAAQIGLPITFIIVKNRRYQALVDFGHVFALEQTIGTELPDIDFCALAVAQGLSARKVAHADALDIALQSAFDGDRPNLIEVCVA
ncbi:benzoylformate decarboxylase [Sphingomonas sp. 28-63-12]|uniref:benzoylformate decarboxylase n=1 Tax=Sphingomonas sp. 28-63-12 TaxID=1970434 RepID=UPI000BD8F368|nr:MAG: benzoylformate decarboxylase [Sphingomonas sp. 28-63-12]